jgi:hypothetical protein
MSLTQRFKLLNAQTAAGATVTVGNTLGPGDGPIFNLMYPQLGASIQAESAGSTTGYKIIIMGRLDGQTWGTIATLDTTSGYTNGNISQITLPAPLLEVKANLATNTGGGTVSCYLVAIG